MRKRRPLRALLAAVGLLVSTLAFAGVSSSDIRDSWGTDEALRRELGRYAAALSGEDFAELAKGGTVARLVRDDTGERVVGAVYAPVSLESMWIAVHDAAHRDADTDVAYRVLPGSTATRQLLYLHVDTPWPMEDRQSMVDIGFNQRLYKESGGRVWERSWHAIPPGDTPAPDPEAMWMPVNEGSWQMVRVGTGTLAVVSMRVEVGGVVPEDVGLRWGQITLHGILDAVVDFAEKMPTHYRSGHAQLARPDGSPIPLDAFTAVASP